MLAGSEQSDRTVLDIAAQGAGAEIEFMAHVIEAPANPMAMFVDSDCGEIGGVAQRGHNIASGDCVGEIHFAAKPIIESHFDNRISHNLQMRDTGHSVPTTHSRPPFHVLERISVHTTARLSRLAAVHSTILRDAASGNAPSTTVAAAIETVAAVAPRRAWKCGGG